jgi:hypothetical protein
MRTARAFERKRRRTRLMLAYEERSPLRRFFTGGVEYDEGLDLITHASFVADFHAFLDLLQVHPAWGEGIEVKFRRLGRHRADGLFYPDPPILIVDADSPRSFAHEFGHLLDFTVGRLAGSREPLLSASPGFEPFRRLFAASLDGRAADDPPLGGAGGRATRRYYASASECFARAFEQTAADALPEPCSLARARAEYRADPFFLESMPPGMADYLLGILQAAPAAGISADSERARPARTILRNG